MKKLTFYFLFLSLSFFAKAQNYGDIVKIKHVLTDTHLHSHAINYSHNGSSRQQQVTGFGGSDDNDYWIIKRRHGDNRRGGLVQHGDIIRLEHLNTRSHLHSHLGWPSPLSNQQEVTCYPNGDDNDNWKVEIEGGGEWNVSRRQRVRLIHVNTNYALHSHQGWSSPTLTAGQQEVTCYWRRDDNDWWMLTEIRPPVDSKNLNVRLAKIWMGECDNPNNCHHEPVAGIVLCELLSSDYLSPPIPVNVGYNNQIWRAHSHSLVCDNFPYEEPGSDLRPIGVTQFTMSDLQLSSNQYSLNVKFNLGVEHQDNPIASRGGHWLESGSNLRHERILLTHNVITRGINVGPFHTNSDRCHEFWLRFTFEVQEKN